MVFFFGRQVARAIALHTVAPKYGAGFTSRYKRPEVRSERQFFWKILGTPALNVAIVFSSVCIMGDCLNLTSLRPP